MPPSFPVELAPHDLNWAAMAEAEGRALALALGSSLMQVHHVGSTSIPGIHAKPIIDLLPVVASLAELDARRSDIEALGYQWSGEYGLPGRRYCTKSDPMTGRRLTQAHCYVQGSPEITRHLAFRDYLRARPDLSQAYDREKRRCWAAYPDCSHAYGDCKAHWINAAEAEALSILPDAAQRSPP